MHVQSVVKHFTNTYVFPTLKTVITGFVTVNNMVLVLKMILKE